jgi:hypothetical protein
MKDLEALGAEFYAAAVLKRYFFGGLVDLQVF